MTENPTTGQPIQATGLTFSDTDFTPEELNATDSPQDEATAQSKPDAKLKLKYNGEEKEITTEEAITLAQKGMNYDHIKSELETIKNSEEAKILSELAKENGFKTSAEYLQSVRDQARQEKISKRAVELENDGVPADHAKRMAELELAAPQASAQPDPSPFLDLFKKYPETQNWKGLEEFPKEVADAIKAGENPVVAYADYKVKQVLSEKERLAADLDAKQRTTGSLTTQATETEPDVFRAGFWGKK